MAQNRCPKVTKIGHHLKKKCFKIWSNKTISWTKWKIKKIQMVPDIKNWVWKSDYQIFTVLYSYFWPFNKFNETNQCNFCDQCNLLGLNLKCFGFFLWYRRWKIYHTGPSIKYVVSAGGALCVEMGFKWTFLRNQDATVKLKSELISIKF